VDPRIIALTGASKGTIIDLTDELSVGRDPDRQLSLNDNKISRHHAMIRREKGSFKIVDLNSHNGTLVNGIPIKEHLLEHRDRIQIGDNVFLFLLGEEKDLSGQAGVQFDEGAVVTISPVSPNLETALYSMARDLNLLIKVSATINTTQSLEALQTQLLESMFGAIPAERAAILLIDNDLDNPSSVCVRDRTLDPTRPIRVSRTVARHVFDEGVAVLSKDVVSSDNLSKSASLIASNIRSLLCVPLLLQKKTFGLIYLETTDATEPLNEEHLQIVTAIASFVSGALHNMSQVERLENENRRLRHDIQIERNLLGESQPMREIYKFIAKVAPTDSTVLILGESGTGKELAARAIHQNSTRANKPFVALNCAVLSETLLESELFGHEKGAFTGAQSLKKGKLEIADGGTLFLDEVAETSPQVQAKLLRVLQEREFERLGGTRPIKVNVRLVAATNKDLDEAIRNQDFRQDLYYRLNVISRTMPPLRKRREDIPLLASYFVLKYNEKCKRQVVGLSSKARDYLVAYDWPGNVRELENAIERALVLGSTEEIQPEDLPEHIFEADSLSSTPLLGYREALREAKKQAIIKALNQAEGKYNKAAIILGLHPNNLHRMIRNLGLKSELTPPDSN
jgi:transcriptional regulator with GAF, ATPase, and Fis domain